MRTRPMPTIGADVTWQRDGETGEWKATPVEKVHHAKGAEEPLPRLPFEAEF